MADEFDLSKFITSSLCLRENSNTAVRPVHLCKDPLSSFWKEDPLKILGVVPFTERKHIPEDTIGTPIQEFYRGLNVLITGGSGFIGKVLLEKLLRDVPHIGHIYILIREKRGKSCQERFQLLMEENIFLRLKAEVPNYHNKVTAVSGDISEPGLGLSNEDRQMILDTVHVVFHSAADVRFLEPLRKAILSNDLGSKHVLDVAKRMTCLKMRTDTHIVQDYVQLNTRCLEEFEQKAIAAAVHSPMAWLRFMDDDIIFVWILSYVHVSTAYSQCVFRVVDEVVPKMSIHYKEIIHYVESNTDSHIEDNLERILQEWPNTYSFSKAMCEDMIQEEAGDLPICIFRPSIVVNAAKEPFRGWTDNVYGPGGLIIAAGLGILHHSKIDPSHSVDMVPVDYVVNCMIAASWSTSMKRCTMQPYVMNYTMSPKNTVCWKTLTSVSKAFETWPYSNSVWYHSFWLIDSELLNYIFYYIHNIQGIVMDAAALLMGQKPRLRKIYSLIHTTNRVVYYFTSGFWEFRNENVLELWHSMTKEDKQMFNFDTSDINILKSAISGIVGFKHFYLKESMDSLPAARRKIKWLRFAHITLKLAFGFVVLKLAVNVARILPI